jgi:hypothetical protein
MMSEDLVMFSCRIPLKYKEQVDSALIRELLVKHFEGERPKKGLELILERLDRIERKLGV